MLVALVGCGNAEKEKAEQKAALMLEYEFEKSVLEKMEKEHEKQEAFASKMSGDIQEMQSRMFSAGFKAKDLPENKQLNDEIRKLRDSIKKSSDEIITQKQKINGIELKIRSM